MTPVNNRVRATPIRKQALLATVALLSLITVILFASSTIPRPLDKNYNSISDQNYSNHSLNTSPQSLSNSMAEYQRYLRKYYNSSYPPFSKPVFSINRPEQPINLVLVRRQKNQDDESFRHQKMLALEGDVDKIQNQSISVEVNQIGSLNGGRTAAHFVLIEGRPGIGKSTLCWQLCRLWREDKMLHKWEIMVIVELRNERARKAKSLYDLFYYFNDKTRLAIEEEIKRREGDGLFLLLDGYDELSKQQLNELSIIHKILTSQLIPKATIVVTSRPVAITALPAEFQLEVENQHIEISGFNESDIHKYITLACEDNYYLLQDFRSYVFYNRFVFSVMYNPLHCTIVTELYRQYWQDGKKGPFPNTLTGIYNALLVHLLRHNLPPYYVIKKLTDVPKDVISSVMELAKLAANGIKEERYIFSDVANKTFGLMVTVGKLYEMRPEQATSYMFLHLTLQEYLAALYWSHHHHQIPKELVKPQFMMSTWNERLISDTEKSRIRWPLYLFLAGITKFKMSTFSIRLLASGYRQTFDGVIPICQLLFESQSSQLVSEMFTNSSLNIISPKTSPLEWFVFGYCVISTDNSTKWAIDFSSSKQLQSFSYGMHYYGKATSDGSSIQMSISDSKVNAFITEFPNLYPFTKAIAALSFPGSIYPNDKCVSILSKLYYYFPRLTVLDLPRIESWPSFNSSFLINIFQLPLVYIKLYLPQYDALLDNIHKQQALTELNIRAGSSAR